MKRGDSVHVGRGGSRDGLSSRGAHGPSAGSRRAGSAQRRLQLSLPEPSPTQPCHSHPQPNPATAIPNPTLPQPSPTQPTHPPTHPSRPAKLTTPQVTPGAGGRRARPGGAPPRLRRLPLCRHPRPGRGRAHAHAPGHGPRHAHAPLHGPRHAHAPGHDAQPRGADQDARVRPRLGRHARAPRLWRCAALPHRRRGCAAARPLFCGV